VGLVRVMEERLGRFGRLLVILMVVSLALGASAWGLKLVWDNAVYPISQFIQTIFEVQPITLEELVKQVVTPLALYIVFSVVFFFLLNMLWRRRVEKPTKRLQAEVERTYRRTLKVFRQAKALNRESEKRMREVIARSESNPDKEGSES